MTPPIQACQVVGFLSYILVMQVSQLRSDEIHADARLSEDGELRHGAPAGRASYKTADARAGREGEPIN